MISVYMRDRLQQCTGQRAAKWSAVSSFCLHCLTCKGKDEEYIYKKKEKKQMKEEDIIYHTERKQTNKNYRCLRSNLYYQLYYIIWREKKKTNISIKNYFHSLILFSTGFAV